MVAHLQSLNRVNSRCRIQLIARYVDLVKSVLAVDVDVLPVIIVTVVRMKIHSVLNFVVRRVFPIDEHFKHAYLSFIGRRTLFRVVNYLMDVATAA